MTDLHGPGIRVPPPLIFLSLGLLGWLLERWLARPTQPVFGTLALLSVGLLSAAGLTLIVAALLGFRKVGTRPEPWKPASALTKTGIYAYTRNPMYLGMALLGLAIGLFLRSAGTLAGIAAACLAVDRWVIPREEAYLQSKFGEAYADYRRRVGRWL